MPTSVNLDEDWRRVSTATGYLDAAVRARRNLILLPRHRAHRLVLDGRRILGAEFVHEGGTMTLRARRTIVSCGAIHTPALLMRNGIGPAAELRDLGIQLPQTGRVLLLCHLRLELLEMLEADLS
jgi:5-(hydroxymethyl)furfural/furfural oxidase